MAIITKLLTKIRAVIRDSGKADTHTEVAGAGRVFTLPQENAYSVSSVTVEGISIANHYTYNDTDKTVTIASGYVSSGDVVVIYFNYYKYSDADLINYIELALMRLDQNGYAIHFDISNDETDIYPNMLPREQSLVAILVKTEIEPDDVQIKTPTMTKVKAIKMTREEKIKQIINIFKVCKSGFGSAIVLGGEEDHYEPI